MTEKHLCELAVGAMNNAYAPYSLCKVGAALLTASGDVYLGCNIENAAYSPSVCAERTAFFKAVSEGQRDFVAIAVAGSRDGLISDGYPPCGVCRQVMTEFCREDFVILVVKSCGEYEKYTLADLLPQAFSNKHITNNNTEIPD